MKENTTHGLYNAAGIILRRYRQLLLLVTAVFVISCENKELCTEHTHGMPVRVVVHWDSVAAKDRPTQGMRLNLFSQDANPHYGMVDLSANETNHQLLPMSSHRALVYDYHGSENIYFRNENHPQLIEAYSAPMTRASYTRANPTETTVAEPGTFFMDRVDTFQVTGADGGDTLHLYPQNILKTYTFTINGVKGAGYVTDTRGALSGMSGSYFLATGEGAKSSSTLLFYAQRNVSASCIEGTFRTFGRIESAGNLFTLEILSASGMDAYAWEVKQKMIAAEQNGSYHITVDADIVVPPPPDTPPGNGGFDIGSGNWDDVVINL
jgi:hypothetical protein